MTAFNNFQCIEPFSRARDCCLQINPTQRLQPTTPCARETKIKDGKVYMHITTSLESYHGCRSP